MISGVVIGHDALSYVRAISDCNPVDDLLAGL